MTAARRGEGRAARSPDDSTLSRAIELVRNPSHLILIYDRDNAPAKVQRQVEKSGLAVICNKPFESHLAQFAALFARRLGLKIGYATVGHPGRTLRHQSGRDAQCAGAGVDCRRATKAR